MVRCVSGTLECSTGAPQGTVLAPFLFTLYTSDLRYNSESCHIQKYSDDTAVVGCVRGGQEKEYKDLVESFNGWTKNNFLLLNTTKTKELVVDFRRSKTPYQSVCIDGGEIETVQTCKYLGVVLNNKLEWSANIEAVYRRGQSHLYFLRGFRSFSVCSDMMCMFYHTIIESALFYAVVCWGSCTTDKNCGHLNKLVKKASSVVGRRLDPLSAVVVQRMRRKLYSVLENNHTETNHPRSYSLRGSI